MLKSDQSNEKLTFAKLLSTHRFQHRTQAQRLAGFLQAAAVLGVAMPVIRGLVAQGILHTTAEYRNGLSKLLSAANVQHFAESYVSTSVLARRFHLHSGSLARHLKESGAPLLAISIPDAAKYCAFFLHKDLAAQIQIPNRKMLREEARRRIVATRKQRWAEYRQAKETTLGKPMRRVRTKCRAKALGLSQESAQ